MASLKKIPASGVKGILAHNDRQEGFFSHKDIDASRSHLNQPVLVRACSPYDYYWARRQEPHCLHRADVKPLCSWVATAPADLPMEAQRLFFKETYAFIAQRYGEKNMVQAVVHRDEAGQPHMHVCFIPAIGDAKHGGEKICANDVITRKDLVTFHGDWQQWLDEHGVHAVVKNGITKAQGGNRTVDQLKYERDHTHTVTREVSHDRWSTPTHQYTHSYEFDDTKGGHW